MRNIITIFKKEIVALFANKSSVFFLLLMPGLLTYFLYSQLGAMELDDQENLENHISRIIVVNQPENFQLDSQFIIIDSNENMDFNQGMINDGEVDVLLNFPINFEENIINDSGLEVELFYNPSLEKSLKSYELIKIILLDYQRNLLFTKYGSNSALDTFNIVEKQFEDQRRSLGEGYSAVLALVVIFIASGTSNNCSDLFVGEKERKTISTLLVTPIKHYEWVFGKLLSGLTFSIIGTASTMIGAALSMTTITQVEAGVESYAGILYTSQEILMILALLFALMLVNVSLISVLSMIAKKSREVIVIGFPITMFMMFVSYSTLGASYQAPTNKLLYTTPIYGHIHALKSVMIFKYEVTDVLLVLVSSVIITIVIVSLIANLAKKESIIYSA